MVPELVFQVGLRATGYTASDFFEAAGWGFNIITAPEIWHKLLTPFGYEIREAIGDYPCYVTYDIDSFDPAYALGTGTPEIGGLTTSQAMELIRAMNGLNIVGFDMVEVSPMYDSHGNTALTAANLMFEILSILPGVEYLQKVKCPILKIVFLAVAAFIILQLVFRFWPLPTEAWRAGGMPTGMQSLVKPGGYYVISQEVIKADIETLVRATPRIKVLQQNPKFVAVVRSAFWGFPDMIEIWKNDRGVHLRGSLIIGWSDYGTNRRRILGWIEQSRIQK